MEAQGDLQHILYDDDVRLDGCLLTGELLPGAGPDCDDCHGSIRDSNDRCPDEPISDDEGCPIGPLQLAQTSRDVEVHLRPRPDSLIIGLIEQGVEVVVVRPEKGAPLSRYVDVRPRHASLAAVTGFFVERAALFTQSASHSAAEVAPQGRDPRCAGGRPGAAISVAESVL